MSTGDSDDDVSETISANNNRSSNAADRSSRDQPDMRGGARDRSSSLRPALFHPPGGHGGGGLPVEAVNAMAKSVSTPQIYRVNNAGPENNSQHTSTEEYSTASSKSP